MASTRNDDEGTNSEENLGHQTPKAGNKNGTITPTAFGEMSSPPSSSRNRSLKVPETSFADTIDRFKVKQLIETMEKKQPMRLEAIEERLVALEEKGRGAEDVLKEIKVAVGEVKLVMKEMRQEIEEAKKAVGDVGEDVAGVSLLVKEIRREVVKIVEKQKGEEDDEGKKTNGGQCTVC